MGAQRDDDRLLKKKKNQWRPGQNSTERKKKKSTQKSSKNIMQNQGQKADVTGKQIPRKAVPCNPEYMKHDKKVFRLKVNENSTLQEGMEQ